MRIGVVGCGYLGAVHAACMSKLGHDVVGLETDAEKASALAAACPPFFEPGLADLLSEQNATGTLRFTDDAAQLADREAVFICVGTPQRKGELAADVSAVHAAAVTAAGVLTGPALVIGKSTVPVGTARALTERLADLNPSLQVAWNPEFLREGHAIDDTLTPDRLVFGVTSPAAEAVLRRVYAAPLAAGAPVVVCGMETAELVKVAANAFLATKISFINAMAEVCEAAGADVTLLAEALGHDERIGRHFLGAGLGFGGGCLPKDIRAFMARAGELGADQALTTSGAGRRWSTWPARPAAARSSAPESRCWGPLSSPTATIFETHRRSTWPPSCGCSAPTWWSPTREPPTMPANCGPTCATPTPPSRRPRAPTSSCCSPSGPSTSPSIPARSVRSYATE
jgi:UDPglucose 6-dehydrogenase